MSIRHVAALTLVGWYLMTPPAHLDGRGVEYTAALSQWLIVGSYDRAKECMAEKTAKVTVAQNQFHRQINTPFPQSAEGHDKALMELLGAEQYLAAECIATDDRRLKEK